MQQKPCPDLLGDYRLLRCIWEKGPPDRKEHATGSKERGKGKEVGKGERGILCITLGTHVDVISSGQLIGTEQ